MTRFLDSLTLNTGISGIIIVLPPLFVELFLLIAYLHILRLLNAVGQCGEHVFFQPAQHEREDLAAQRGHYVLVIVALNGVGVLAVEIIRGAKHRGIEENGRENRAR